MTRTRADRRSYQKDIANHIVNVPQCAVWAGMGAGKTGATLDAIDQLLTLGEVSRVLIVAPKRVASITWPDEIKEWAFSRDLTYRVHVGNRTKIEHNIRSGSRVDIDLINWDNLPWLVDTLAKKSDWVWDLIVLDESSVFKRPSTRRFKALRKLRRIIPRWVQLTGTPSSNGLLSLWTQAFILDQGERLGKAYGAYQQAYFDVENPYSDHPKFVPKPGTEAKISAKLADITIVVDPKDYLDVHATTVNRVHVELPAKLRDQYEQFENELFLELENNGGDIEAPNAAVLKNKLQQFCNGAVYDVERNAHEIHTLKLDALREIRETMTAPFLLAFSYRHDWARIKRVLGKDATLFDDDPDILKRWNSGDVPFLCAHPASIGHGLSLQHGSNQVIWFGMTYNLEHFLQFNERVGGVRQAQSGYNRGLSLNSITIKNSVEDEVAAAISAKDATQASLMNAVKRLASRKYPA